MRKITLKIILKSKVIPATLEAEFWRITVWGKPRHLNQ
jgi:hypothetical protein